MYKRKSNTSKSRTTSSTLPRTQFSESNLIAPASVSSQAVADVGNSQPVCDKLHAWPVSPPRGHPRYVPPTPRVHRVPITDTVTLSLEVKHPDEPTDFFEIGPLTQTPAAATSRFEFKSQFTTQFPESSFNCTLRPVFDWDGPTYTSALSDSSSDEEVDTESDEEAESLSTQQAIGERENCKPAERVTDKENTSVTDSADKQKDESSQGNDAEESQEGEKKDAVAIADLSDDGPDVEEAPEHSEQDTESASVSPTV